MKLLLFVIAYVLTPASCGVGQHCPPIVESYVSGLGVKRTKNGIDFQFTYTKTGGQTKDAFQAYILAYPDSKTEAIEKLTPQHAIESGLATIAHTCIAKTNGSGDYTFGYSLDTETFVSAMLNRKLITKSRTTNAGGWKAYDGEIRLALFVPFLDDKKYSVLGELPDDKHECNYRGDSALLFQPITQKLSIRFGVVQAVKLDAGKHYIEINGNRPKGDIAR
jgi:hypothetical protein